MYHYVKRWMGVLLCLSTLLVGRELGAQEMPAHRQMMLPARLDAELYQPFAEALQQSSLWHIPLEENIRQIVRLQQFTLTPSRPLYATLTAIAPQQMQLTMALTHELWQGDRLVWTETRQRQQQWQYPGPRALGVGQSPMAYLSYLPRGAFSPLQAPSLASPFQTALFTQLSHDLTQSYLRWKQQQEHNL